jgi:CRISPR-associated protein Csy1
MEHAGLSAKIADYIASRAEPKLEGFDKQAEKRRKAAKDEAALAELDLKLAAERQEVGSKYNPAYWLTDAAQRAKQRQLVTHALKFTNPDAKGSSLFSPGGSCQPKDMQPGEVLSTASLDNPDIDSVGNAAALDVAIFLQLEDNGKTLVEHLKSGDPSAIRPFSQNEEQLAGWVEGFLNILVDNDLGSHKYAKQLYFPVDGKQYHLLSPLFSSSLSQALYRRITASRFSEEGKAARKAKRESKYSETVLVDFPNTAIQTFGGANKQNVSHLNTSRVGRSFLLNCSPPDWQTQTKPPLGTKTVFSRNHFGLRVRKEVWALQQYLVRMAERSSTVDVREQRAERVDDLIDILVQYGAEIQNLTQDSGWSALPECRLNRAEQLWLDPYRAQNDPEFAREREKNDWQGIVADKFAFWLNNRLKHKKLTFGDTEHAEWKKLAEQSLLTDNLEVFA